jgi:HK97 family phage portal protein
VIVSVRNRGNVEMRTVEWGSSAIPMPGWGANVYSGAGYTTEKALGLSAVGSAVRLIALVIASMDLCVFTGTGADKRAAESSWQDKLLDNPSPDQSQFDLLSDIATGPETFGNSLVLKVKGLLNRRVVALVPLDMNYASIKRDPRTKEKVFQVTVEGETSTYSPSEILHFRGWTIPGKVSGYSPLTLHRQALGNAVALEEFEGRFFSNDASPGGALKIPGNVKTSRAMEILDVWEATHRGLGNAHRPALLANGAEWVATGVNLQDAQFIESQRYGVEQVARIWGIAPEMLGHPLTKPEATEQLGLRLLNFTILPRLRRIEQTFACDPDMFGTDSVYPEFVTDDLLRTDALTSANVEHMQIQDGTKLVDEIRAEHGDSPLPPVPSDWTKEPGKVPQITPVGGAPNPTATTNGTAPPANPVSGTVPVPKSLVPTANGSR